MLYLLQDIRSGFCVMELLWAGLKQYYYPFVASHSSGFGSLISSDHVIGVIYEIPTSICGEHKFYFVKTMVYDLFCTNPICIIKII